MKRIIYWALAAPLLAVIFTPFLMLVIQGRGHESSIKNLQTFLGITVALALPTTGVLCLWSAHLIKTDPELARLTLIILGIVILFLCLTMPRF